MEPVFDFGAHAAYVWPAYGAFALIFAGLFLWAARTNASARRRLAELEKEQKR